MSQRDVVNFVLSQCEEEEFPGGPDIHGWSVRVKANPNALHEDEGWLYLNTDPEVSASDMGFATAEEAIEAYRRWCLHRGFEPEPVAFGLKGVRRG